MSIKAVLDTSPHCPECAFKHLAAIHGLALARGPFGGPVDWEDAEAAYHFETDVTAVRIRLLTMESLLPEYRRNIPVAVALLASVEPCWITEKQPEACRNLRKALMGLIPFEQEFAPEAWLGATRTVRLKLKTYVDAVLGQWFGSNVYRQWGSKQGKTAETLWALTSATSHAREFQRECPPSIWDSFIARCTLPDIIHDEFIRSDLMAECYDAMVAPNVDPGTLLQGLDLDGDE